MSSNLNILRLFLKNEFDFIYHEHMSYYSINGIYNFSKTMICS